MADVSQSLPRALKSLKHDIRLILPAYASVKKQVKLDKALVSTTIQHHPITLYETLLPGTRLPVWLIDCPEFFEREGNPYTAPDGNPWPDNAERFALFSIAVAALANNNLGLKWQPDILHCNDWQTGLAPALLNFEPKRPGVVFTIHNLAYQGLFSYTEFAALNLPDELWAFDAMEYHDQFNFIKGGIVYADKVTTVSPSYAKEIQAETFGCGLDPVLRYHQHKLSGIINGINTEEWNPFKDPHLISAYNSNSLKGKVENKRELQRKFNLACDDAVPIFSTISRLASQKGIDLILKLIPRLIKFNVQMIILGSGDQHLEQQLITAAKKHSQHISVKIGYDEKLAHQITAGADFFMMPSRYEPCGLNQMYSQHYGTIPIVRATGGLEDTVIDNTDDINLNTGIKFQNDSTTELFDAIVRALAIFADKKYLVKMQRNGMRKDFSWKNSAEQYSLLYEQIISARLTH